MLIKIPRAYRLCIFTPNALKGSVRNDFPVIRPVITYPCVTWILKETIINRLMVLERKIPRKIYGPTYEDGVLRIG